MRELQESRGAVEIVAPDESVAQRLEAIMAVASVCDKLAAALNVPIQQVTITGNITANAEDGVKTKNRKPRSA